MKKITVNAYELIRNMSDKQLKQYQVHVDKTNGPSDHDLLLTLVKEVKDIKINIKNINSRLDNIVKLNNLKE